MTDFKVGDRVRNRGTSASARRDELGTVDRIGLSYVYVKSDAYPGRAAEGWDPRNLELWANASVSAPWPAVTAETIITLDFGASKFDLSVDEANALVRSLELVLA